MYGLHRTGDIPLRRAVKADGRIVPLFEQQEQSEQLRTAFTALRHPEAQAVQQTCTVILRAVRIRTAERKPEHTRSGYYLLGPDAALIRVQLVAERAVPRRAYSAAAAAKQCKHHPARHKRHGHGNMQIISSDKPLSPRQPSLGQILYREDAVLSRALLHLSARLLRAAAVHARKAVRHGAEIWGKELCGKVGIAVLHIAYAHKLGG